jgi:hypothetical protein
MGERIQWKWWAAKILGINEAKEDRDDEDNREENR